MTGDITGLQRESRAFSGYMTWSNKPFIRHTNTFYVHWRTCKCHLSMIFPVILHSNTSERVFFLVRFLTGKQ